MIRRTALAILGRRLRRRRLCRRRDSTTSMSGTATRSTCPPGFSPLKESGNGDGGVSYSADGKSKLAVWGVNALLDTLAADAESRIQSAQDDDWAISYSKVSGRWASWSGEKAGPHLLCPRNSGCVTTGVAAFPDQKYPKEAKDAFDPLVQKLVKGFRATSCD